MSSLLHTVEARPSLISNPEAIYLVHDPFLRPFKVGSTFALRQLIMSRFEAARHQHFSKVYRRGGKLMRNEKGMHQELLLGVLKSAPSCCVDTLILRTCPNKTDQLTVVGLVPLSNKILLLHHSSASGSKLPKSSYSHFRPDCSLHSIT